MLPDVEEGNNLILTRLTPVATLTDTRTVARKSSIGGLYVCAGGLYVHVWGGLTFKFDKNSTNLQCFIFQFGRAWSFVWGLSPPKPPLATGLIDTKQQLATTSYSTQIVTFSWHCAIGAMHE